MLVLITSFVFEFGGNKDYQLSLNSALLFQYVLIYQVNKYVFIYLGCYEHARPKYYLRYQTLIFNFTLHYQLQCRFDFICSRLIVGALNSKKKTIISQCHQYKS